jgi:hypothetical protein
MHRIFKTNYYTCTEKAFLLLVYIGDMWNGYFASFSVFLYIKTSYNVIYVAKKTNVEKSLFCRNIANLWVYLTMVSDLLLEKLYVRLLKNRTKTSDISYTIIYINRLCREKAAISWQKNNIVIKLILD